jgi:hypothetical protein
LARRSLGEGGNDERSEKAKTRRKTNHMKNRNTLTKVTLLFAVLLTLGATRSQADILPGVSITFAPVGLTMDQTARLNLVNVGLPNGMLVSWRFIDANGLTLAQSVVTLPLGKIVSVDYRRNGYPLPAEPDSLVDIQADGAGFSGHGEHIPPNPNPPPQIQLERPPFQNRVEVRAQVDIVNAGIPSESLRRSLELFNNDTGATTVFMGGTAP